MTTPEQKTEHRRGGAVTGTPACAGEDVCEVPGGPLNPCWDKSINSCCAAPSAPPRLRLRPSAVTAWPPRTGSLLLRRSALLVSMERGLRPLYRAMESGFAPSSEPLYAAPQHRFPPGAMHLKTRWKAKGPNPAESGPTSTRPSTSGNRKRSG